MKPSQPRIVSSHVRGHFSSGAVSRATPSCYSPRHKTECTLSGRWVEPSKEIFPESDAVRTNRRPVGVSARLSTWTGLNTTKRGHTEDNPRAFTHPAAHPAAPCQNGRCLPALRSGRVCNGRSPPPPSRAWRPRAPDEGRCRADPHCTHDGIRRHCRNDHRYFHAVHQPTSPLRRRRHAHHPTHTSRHHGAVPHRAVGLRHSATRRRTDNDDHGTDGDHTATTDADTDADARRRRPPPHRRHRRTAATATARPPVTDATSVATADWLCIRVHESGDRTTVRPHRPAPTAS